MLHHVGHSWKEYQDSQIKERKTIEQKERRQSQAQEEKIQKRKSFGEVEEYQKKKARLTE